MSELTPYIFPATSQSLRAHTDEEGNPWFLRADACASLDIANVTDSTRGFYPDDLGTFEISNVRRDAVWVSEAGLYRLIFASRKPNALAFQQWIVKEVIPRIRRTGAYMAEEIRHQLEERINENRILRTDLAIMELDRDHEKQRYQDLLNHYTPDQITRRANTLKNTQERIDQVIRWLTSTRLVGISQGEWVWMSNAKLHLEYVQWCIEQGERYMEGVGGLVGVMRRLRCVIPSTPVRPEDLIGSGHVYGETQGFSVPPLHNAVSKYTGEPLADSAPIPTRADLRALGA